MDEARALARLRDPEGRALTELARLMVLETTATPIRAIATPRWIASQIAAALEAATAGDAARVWVDRRIAEQRDAWRTDTRTPRRFVPPEVDAPLRKLLARPYAPAEKIVVRIIDHPAMQAVIREVLEDTLVRFHRRIRQLDAGLGGVGGLGLRAAKRAGRGLFGNLGQNLAGLGENLVGGLAEELEHALHERITEFTTGATGEAVRTVARNIADPRRAASWAELRLAALDALLDSPMHELAAELDGLGPEQAVDIVVAAIRSQVDDPQFVSVTEDRVRAVLDATGDGTLGAWLDEVGLRDVWTTTTTELVAGRLQAVVQGDAFGAWWADLFRDD